MGSRVSCTSKNQRFEVVSLRVTFEEKEIIIDKAACYQMSIADVLREAVNRAGLFKQREA